LPAGGSLLMKSSAPFVPAGGGQVMLRWALRSLLLSLLLFAIGYLSNASVWFEVLRIAAGGLLALGIVLLLVNHARTPSPPEK
jgi:hypothetical protein